MVTLNNRGIGKLDVGKYPFMPSSLSALVTKSTLRVIVSSCRFDESIAAHLHFWGINNLLCSSNLFLPIGSVFGSPLPQILANESLFAVSNRDGLTILTV